MSKVSGSAHVDLQGTMLVATLLLHHWLGLSLMPSSGVLPQGVLLSQDVVCLPAYCLIEFMYVFATRCLPWQQLFFATLWGLSGRIAAELARSGLMSHGQPGASTRWLAPMHWVCAPFGYV